MRAHRFRERAEHDARGGEPLLEGGRDGDAVEYRVHRDPGEARALVERYAELLVGLEELRVDLVEALRAVSLRPGCGRMGERLLAGGGEQGVCPGGPRHGAR